MSTPVMPPDEPPGRISNEPNTPYPPSQAATPSPPAIHTDDEYLHGRKLYLVLMGILLGVFLIAIDQTIVANALPIIASVFNALDELAWIPTAFLLTQSAFLLVFGQLPQIFSLKWLFLFAVALFEIGSLLSGVAPDVRFLIFARAFQGIGASGMFVIGIAIVAEIVPMTERPKVFGAVGGVFGISGVVGPLLGGALTQHVSWRWCFYINLPLSVPTILFMLLIVKAKPPRMIAGSQYEADSDKIDPGWFSGFKKLPKLDWIGAILVLGTTTCLVLGLQWGGNSKPWRSTDVIVTLVLSGVFLAAFLVWERYKGDSALLPLKLFKSRTQVGAFIAAFWTRAVFFAAIYYLPLYFQAVKNHSTVKSGLDLIPITITLVITAAIAGIIVSKTGRVWYFLVFGPCVGAVGFGLLYTLSETTSWGKIIGYQILAGIGIGTSLQNTVLVVQAAVPRALIPQASALVTFGQFLGGIIGVALTGTVFQNKLATGLKEFAPDAPFELIRQSVTVLNTLPPDQKAGAVHAYVDALRLAFLAIGVSGSILTSLGSLIIQNFDIRTPQIPPSLGNDNIPPATPDVSAEGKEGTGENIV